MQLGSKIMHACEPVKRALRVARTTALAVAAISSAQAQDAGPEQIGQVTFPVSCSAAAQHEFNRAMALFHSFWFQPAIASFQEALKQDRECGMAYWGIAIMSLGNPFAWPPTAEAMETGEGAMAEARRIGAKTTRERDYIATLDLLFKVREQTPFQPRAVAFERAMQELTLRYPEDDEARILDALLLDVTASPEDKTYANQQAAGHLLEPLFEKYPRHPGVAHYLIHTYDYAGLAEKGLAAARVYATIAPAAPHALHMPSHVFSRLGLWREMTASNRASYEAAQHELSDKSLSIYALHAMDYLTFGLLQLAQDDAVRRIVDAAASTPGSEATTLGAAYALAAIPARFAIERGDWKGAAALPLRDDLAAFPQAQVLAIYTRGLGAARSGDVAGARAEEARLRALREAIAARHLQYWAAQTEIYSKTLEGLIARAENLDTAVPLLAEAADAEDASDKHPITPGELVPARQLLAETLLETGSPAHALVEFERILQRNPHRFRATYGAARAAEAISDRDKATGYYKEISVLSAEGRPEVAYARRFLTLE